MGLGWWARSLSGEKIEVGSDGLAVAWSRGGERLEVGGDGFGVVSTVARWREAWGGWRAQPRGNERLGVRRRWAWGGGCGRVAARGLWWWARPCGDERFRVDTAVQATRVLIGNT
ncbi:hypothetical protein Salat_1141300 [Sesamum alatum]|uniref:Uncharacterized protein n=1 Tax=Sesamum alatum TaxID=300844 RepID=A0AAE2CN86_9LAMI|nr:hypothetical protein Salat_1141300 [Sesamum alatum]